MVDSVTPVVATYVYDRETGDVVKREPTRLFAQSCSRAGGQSSTKRKTPTPEMIKSVAAENPSAREEIEDRVRRMIWLWEGSDKLPSTLARRICNYMLRHKRIKDAIRESQSE